MSAAASPGRTRPLRLLHLIPSMQGGGAERQVSLIAAAQQRAGHEVHVGVVSGGPNLSALQAEAVPVHWLRVAGSHDPRLLTQAAAVVQRTGADLVQTWLTQMDIVGGMAAMLRSRPWIATECSSHRAYGPTLKNWLRKRVVGRADAIVANSEAGAAYWQEVLGWTEMPPVIPNLIALDEIDATEPTQEAIGSAKRPLVLYAGRFSAPKNVPGLVRAAERLLRRADVTVAFCGAGPEIGEVHRLIAMPEFAGRAVLLGYRTDLWALMKRADVFVSVSNFEGRPNTVLEAMAAGCPVVVSDIEAHREFLDARNGLLAPPDDPDAIADALLDALTDRESARARAARARRVVEPFGAKAVLRQFDAVYDRVLAGVRPVA